MWAAGLKQPTIPLGMNSTMPMMRAPKTAWCMKGKLAHICSLINESATAPTTGPMTVPRPPNMVMIIICTVIRMVNTSSGSM